MSLLPKTIYNIQRTSDGTAWEEKYVSGSSLVLQTDINGNLIGSSLLPVTITSSIAISASYSITSSFSETSSYYNIELIDCGTY